MAPEMWKHLRYEIYEQNYVQQITFFNNHEICFCVYVGTCMILQRVERVKHLPHDVRFALLCVHLRLHNGFPLSESECWI